MTMTERSRMSWFRSRNLPRTLASTLALGLWCSLPSGCQSASESTSSGTPASADETAPDDPRLVALRREVRDLITTARDRVFPALVNIDVVSLEYQGGKETKNRSTGSGTIISPDGYVLTNAHVTDDGSRFFLILSDKQRVPGKLIGEDPWTDLAIIKIDTSKLKDPTAPLPFAKFGDSDQLGVGDYVLAMGSPFALSRTVTLGIVSNTERVFTSSRDAGEVDEMLLNWEQRTGLFTNWIQHDALINPGNSGGPLVNLQGQVVGVNTRGGSGNAFATPSNLAKFVATNLQASGEVPRSSIGASFRHTQNTGIAEGVLIDSVDSAGPANSAGLRAGDVIVAIDGKPANVRYAEEIPPLLRQLAEKPIGAKVSIAYKRKDQPAAAELVTEKLLKDKGDEAALRVWGLTAKQITERLAKQRKLGTTSGAMISSIRGGGPAEQAEPKLGWGDVVKSIDDTPITSLESLVEKYKQINQLKDKPEYVLIRFEREGKDFVTLIKPKPEDRPDPPPELPKAWIGVATQPVIKNMAEKLGIGDQRGYRVVRVYSGTKAAEAGLKIGDIILALNGERLSPRGLQDAGVLNRAVRQRSIDEKSTLSVLRDGKVMDLSITLEATRPTPEEAKRERDRDFELAVRDITFFDREDEKWDQSVQGVIVDSAEPAGWAGLAGVAGGDLIQRIGDYEVTDLASYKLAMKAIKDAQPERVVVVVYRGVRTFFRFIEPDWKPTTKNEQPAAGKS